MKFYDETEKNIAMDIENTKTTILKKYDQGVSTKNDRMKLDELRKTYGEVIEKRLDKKYEN